MYPPAIDQFQLSLAKETRPETELALGESFAAMDQHLLAAVHFRRYLERNPDDPEILNRLGCLELRLDELEQASATFRRLIRLDRESARTGLVNVDLKLGEQLYKQGQHRAAADRFIAALTVGGTDQRALDGIRKSLKALYEKQLPKQAAAALDTALELYDRGETTGLRPLLERAWAASGKPGKSAARVKKALSDPRLAR